MVTADIITGSLRLEYGVGRFRIEVFDALYLAAVR